MVVTKILAIQSLKTYLKSTLWGKICIFLVLGVEDKLLFALCYLYIANSVKLEKFIGLHICSMIIIVLNEYS